MKAIDRRGALRVLLVIWGVGAGVLSALMFLQAVMGKYGADAKDALSWLLNATAPTLALVASGSLSDASKRWFESEADPFRYRLAAGASILYFLCLLFVLLVEPFVGMSSFELFDLSSLPLAVGQGLTVAAITAVIFDKRS